MFVPATRDPLSPDAWAFSSMSASNGTSWWCSSASLPSASKVRSRSAATLTAMVAGSLPVMSASPIGVLIRSMAASS